jgi:hypothetical protein
MLSTASIFAGTLEERGIIAWNAQHDLRANEAAADEEAGAVSGKSRPGLEVYDFPFGMDVLKR